MKGNVPFYSELISLLDMIALSRSCLGSASVRSRVGKIRFVVSAQMLNCLFAAFISGVVRVFCCCSFLYFMSCFIMHLLHCAF